MSEHHHSLSDPAQATGVEAVPQDSRPTRRTVLTGAAALAAVGFVPQAAHAAGRGSATGPSGRITVLGTTDLHGNVLNWDYFKNAEYDDRFGNDIGLAKVSTLVTAVRDAVGASSTVMIDAGDTIQGTPLAYYYAKIDPITEGAVHPMAKAMNLIGYDAAALGNHEFNYGIPLLRKFEEQCDFPLLGANAHDAASNMPAFPPYAIKKIKLEDGRHVRVGILGLTNPGIALWDKANVEGRMVFPGLVEQAKRFVPQLKAAGADVVVVAAHSGTSGTSSYGDQVPHNENAAAMVAEKVPGVDAVLVGHAHKEIAEMFVTNEVTGQRVLLTEPLMWGQRLSVITIDVEMYKGRWRVTNLGSQVLNSNTVEPDERVVVALTDQHDAVVDYVNTVIGTSEQEMTAARAMVEDTAIIDFVNLVQAETVKSLLAGTAHAGLPVLSIAAPFNRNAAIPQGPVSVRDVAGVYIYDNTLLAVKLTGAQLRDYLEYSAKYFEQVGSTGPFTIDEVDKAGGTPDYNYDVVGGLDAPLAYDIDLSQPVGSRIRNLTYAGGDVPDAMEFALAINNYRQSGGGNFPHVAAAPVLWAAEQLEIRQLIIDWVAENKVVDPSGFFSQDWRLTFGDEPVRIS
ncbi:MAG TPA: 5'-nucleotidase C-terminal domain-containing protein [Nocardioidaceae bacterium]